MSSSTDRRDGEFSRIPITFPHQTLRIDDELGPGRPGGATVSAAAESTAGPRARYGELSPCCRAQQPQNRTPGQWKSNRFLNQSIHQSNL